MEFVDLQAQRRRLSPQIEDAIARVLEHGKFISGPEVAELEEKLAEFAGVRYCVSCANGTDALVLALKASGLKSGQGVVVPSFTFAATAEAVVLAGGVPVFADIDPNTFNLEPQSAAGARKEAEAAGIDVAGVMPVDLFGQPAPYELLRQALPELWFVADAAQSFGAAVGDSRVGSLAAVTTTSFFPAKPLGCYGDGGAILTDDNEIAQVLRSLRVHGQGSDKYDNVRVGTNSRLDTIQAAILLVKLDAFPAELEQRQRVADHYRKLLVGSPVQTPIVLEGHRSAWAQYTVRVAERDTVAARLTAAGVPTAVYYRQPLHRSTAYATFGGGSVLEETDTAATEVLSLPMHPDMTAEDIDIAVTALLT
jgi:dTDP-4-amino-4,6-dideoxygalactose transaminase